MLQMSTDKLLLKLWFRDTKKFMLFDVSDLNFDVMTLTIEHYLDMIVTYFCTIDEVGQ